MKIQEAIKMFKGGETGLCRFMGLSRSTLNRVRNGHEKPSPMLLILLKHAGIELEVKPRSKFSEPGLKRGAE